MNELDKMLEACPSALLEDGGLVFTLSKSIYEAHKHLLKEDSYKGIPVETYRHAPKDVAVLCKGSLYHK